MRQYNQYKEKKYNKKREVGVNVMAEEYLTVEEVCKWLKTSRATVNRWRKQGMPFVKAGKLVRFKKSEVEQWLQKENVPKN